MNLKYVGFKVHICFINKDDKSYEELTETLKNVIVRKNEYIRQVRIEKVNLISSYNESENYIISDERVLTKDKINNYFSEVYKIFQIIKKKLKNTIIRISLYKDEKLIGDYPIDEEASLETFTTRENDIEIIKNIYNHDKYSSVDGIYNRLIEKIKDEVRDHKIKQYSYSFPISENVIDKLKTNGFQIKEAKICYTINDESYYYITISGWAD